MKSHLCWQRDFIEGKLRSTDNEYMLATFGPVMETMIKTFLREMKGEVDAIVLLFSLMPNIQGRLKITLVTLLVH